MKHKKKYGVYHWDTFDNVTIFVKDFDKQSDADTYIRNNYKVRDNGADVVEIVTKDGKAVGRYSIG